MAVGETKDVGWEIGVSRTIDGQVDDVWRTLVSPAGVALWLVAGATLPPEPGAPIEVDPALGSGELRSLRPHDRVRVTWTAAGADHETTVQVTVAARGDRTMVRFHEERLTGPAERAARHDHWVAVMDQLEALLVT
jgi:uncharacterized protein YndB with AHSA1/START domain